MKAKIKILIIEDERIVAEDIKRTLKYLGYIVSSAVSSAIEAIKEVKKNTPDLVLMDIKLRGNMDGVEAAKKIRACFDIPIVYITAIADEKTLERAKVTEPFGYIHKPVEEKELYTAIEMALYRYDMEKKLRESEEHYRSLFSCMKEGVCLHEVIYDKSGKAVDYRITDVNPSYQSILGIPKEKAVGSLASELYGADEAPYLDIYAEVAETGKPTYFETYFPPMDKHFSISVFSPGKGKFVTVLSDITERKKAEEEREKLQAQLIQSEKMAGIGTLTSGIAHEFNNLLQIIKGHAEFAQKTKKPKDIEEAFDTVISNVDRAAKIIKDLLTFSRQEPSEIEPCDIIKSIESVLSLTEEQLDKRNIKVERRYKKTPPIEVNRGEIEQVFLNMITNARDAMLPEGGKLKIEVKRTKGNVEVSFADKGGGIEKENLDKVFEPFYTTKGAIGKNDIPGIGLGLSVSSGIVRRHGGTIEVESKVGKGTTFTVKLPVKREGTKEKSKRK